MDGRGNNAQNATINIFEWLLPPLMAVGMTPQPQLPQVLFDIPPAAAPQGRSLPPPPSLADFLSKVPPPPPPSPQEIALSQFLKSPEFMKDFITVFTLTPEYAQNLINMLRVIAPRAFPDLNLEFETKYREQQKAQAIESWQLAAQEWKTFVDEENRRFALISQSIPNVKDLPSFFQLYQQALRLSPENYTLIKPLLTAKLTELVQVLPPQMSERLLSQLVERGYITADEAQMAGIGLTQRRLWLDASYSSIFATLDKYENAAKVFQNLGVNVEPFLRAISTLREQYSQLKESGIELTLDEVSKITRQLSNVFTQFSAIRSNLTRVTEQIASNVIRTANQLISGVLRPDWRQSFQSVIGLIQRFDPSAASGLIDELGKISEDDINARIKIVESIFSSLKTMIGTLKNYYSEIANIDPQTGLHASAMLESAEKFIDDLSGQFPSIQQSVREFTQDLADIADFVRKNASKFFPSQVAQKVSTKLRELSLGLSQARLNLQKEMFNKTYALRLKNYMLSAIRVALAGIKMKVQSKEATAEDISSLLNLLGKASSVHRNVSTILGNPLISPDIHDALRLLEVRVRGVMDLLAERLNNVLQNKKPQDKITLDKDTEQLLDALIEALGQELIPGEGDIIIIPGAQPMPTSKTQQQRMQRQQTQQRGTTQQAPRRTQTQKRTFTEMLWSR